MSFGPRLACIAAAIIGWAAPARADFLWFDDSRPGALRIEANGFTRAPLVLTEAGIGHVLTDGTFENRDLILPAATRVSFAGTFSLFYVPAATFAFTDVFLPPSGGTAPVAELVLDGRPEGGGEHVSGVFLGQGDAALPRTVTLGARPVVINPDWTFPFATQNLSVLISLAPTPAGIAEPAGLGALGLGVSGLALARRRRRL